MPLIRHRRARRVIAAALIVTGAVVMWLSPSVQPGLLAFALGVGLELVGLVLERRSPR
jgi:drug/metabolite transporter (DMT)-like permease